MNDFTNILILIYFKEKANSYSYVELACLLGISINFLEEQLNKLINENMLEFSEKNLLNITEKGRLSIINHSEFYSFKINNDDTIFKNPKSIGTPYAPKKFLSKIT